jgi:hypothetical protein
MFWDAVVGGLKVLAHWQTYVAGLEYLAIYMVPMAAFGFIMQSENVVEKLPKAAAGSIGCLSIVLLPLLQVAALIVFILTMSPIIFGISDQAAWAFPFSLIGSTPLTFLKLVGILTVAAIILGVIPVFGRIQALHTLFLGALALGFVLYMVEYVNPGAVLYRVRVWPGIWFLVGLLAVGALMSWAGMMLSAILVTALEKVTGEFAQLFMFPLAAIFGFIPVFMYGAWLGAQLRVG